MKISKEAIYTFLISSLIISQIFGLYGGALVPVRALTILYIPFLFDKKAFKELKSNTTLIFLYLVFIIDSIFLFLLYQESINYNSFIYLNINILILIEFYAFSKYISNIYKVVWNSWAIFLLLSFPIAFIEIFLDIHLPISYLESDQVIGALGVQKKFASVTFGNYNQYVFVLCCAMPIIISRLLVIKKESLLIKLLIYFIIVSVLYIIITNGSRGGILACLICLGLYFYYKYKQNIRNTIFLIYMFLIITIISGTLIYLINYTSYLDYILFRLNSKGYEDNSRTELIQVGITMLVDSYFLGVGPGNYMDNLINYRLTVSKLPPHNMFIELLSEYGLFFFLIFSYFFLNIFSKYFFSKVFSIKYILISSFIISPIIFVINSVYIEQVYMWLFLGTLYVLTKRKYEIK